MLAIWAEISGGHKYINVSGNNTSITTTPKAMAYTKRRRDTYEDDNGAGPVDAPAGSAQVLPVADLPEDFDGEAEDGATYLALAS